MSKDTHTGNYDRVMEAVKSLDNIIRIRWKAMAKRYNKSLMINCPVCLVDNTETRLTIDMCIPPPPDEVDKNDPLINMGFCVQCKTCGHKDYFEMLGKQPEGMNIEKVFRRKQRKRRRKRQ